MERSRPSLHRPLTRRWHARAIVCALAAVLLAGCREEEGIKSYTVPKPERVEPIKKEEGPKVRLLAAIMRRGEQTWFFKLVGPTAAVDEQEKVFDGFIRSIRFTDDAKKPIRWQAPEGWTEEPGKGIRYATFRLGPKGAPLELTVFAFGADSGSMLDNINRWRRLDLGVPDIAEAELKQVSREVKVEGVTAILVDMKGPGAPKSGKPPFGPSR